MQDTTPEALSVWIDLTRKLTPGERIARSFEMCEFTEHLQLSALRKFLPGASDEEIRQYLFEKAHGRSFAAGR